MESNDAKRMKLLLAYLKENANSLSAKLGIPNNLRIYHVLKGRNGISSSLANLICSKYSKINYEWLTLGKGYMLSENPDYFPNAHDRVKHLMAFYKMDVSEFISKTGLDQLCIAEIIKEDKNPENNVLLKIQEAFPEVNIDWIIDNNGFMIAKADQNAPLKESSYKSISSLDLINQDIPNNIGDQFNYSMRGESMLPVYRNGDILGCRIVDKESIIEWGRNYFIQINNGNIVRKIANGDDKKIVLQSKSSESYPDITMFRIDILKLAIVTECVKYE